MAWRIDSAALNAHLRNKLPRSSSGTFLRKRRCCSNDVTQICDIRSLAMGHHKFTSIVYLSDLVHRTALLPQSQSRRQFSASGQQSMTFGTRHVESSTPCPAPMLDTFSSFLQQHFCLKGPFLPRPKSRNLQLQRSDGGKMVPASESDDEQEF